MTTPTYSKAISQARSLLIVIVAVISALALSACSEDRLFDDDSAFGKQVNALVSKGPVSGSTCTLYKKDGTEVAGPKTTGSDGRADFGAVSGVTDSDVIYVQCKGGSYTDEATGTTKSAPSDGMRGGVMADKSTVTVVITPATEVAFRKADASSDLDNLETYNKNVAKALGLGSDFQPAETEPTDLGSASAGNDASGQYAVLLATLSQLQLGGSLGDGLDTILDNLEKCINAADGTIDKTCAQKLIDSITDLESNNKVKDKVDDTASSGVSTNLGDVDVTSDDTIVVTDTSPDALERPASITSSITASGEGLDNVDEVNLTEGATSTGACTITSQSDSTLVLDCSSFTTDASADSVTLEFVSKDGSEIVNKLYYSIDLSDLDPNTTTFTNGANKTLAYKDTSTDAATCVSGSPSYSSSDTSIATVDGSGVVTAEKVGTAAITATCPAVTDTYLADIKAYTVTVTKASPTLTWSPAGTDTSDDYTTDTAPLTRTAAPSIGTCTGTVTYASGNSAIGTVTSGGVVQYKNTGAVAITASYPGDTNCEATSDSYNLTINTVPNTVVSVSGSSSAAYDATFDVSVDTTIACLTDSDPSYDSAYSFSHATDDNTGALTLVSGTTYRVTGVGDGTADMLITCEDTGPYTDGTTDYDATVTKAQVDLTWDGYTGTTGTLGNSFTDQTGDVTIDVSYRLDFTTLTQAASVVTGTPAGCLYTSATDITYDVSSDPNNITAGTVGSGGAVDISQDGTNDLGFAGTALIQADYSDDANCEGSAPITYNLVIQTVTNDVSSFATIQDMTYGDPTLDISVGYTVCKYDADTATVTYDETGDTSLITVTSGGSISIDGAGTGAGVIAECGGNTTQYTDGTTDQTFDIAKADLMLHFERDGNRVKSALIEKTNGNTLTTPPVAVFSGFQYGDDTNDLNLGTTFLYQETDDPQSLVAVTGATGVVTLNNGANPIGDAIITAAFTDSSNTTNYNDISADYTLLVRDVIPTGSAATYSLRQVVPDYTGDAIRVRDPSNDDHTFDIGFDSSGDLDYQSLYAHIADVTDIATQTGYSVATTIASGADIVPPAGANDALYTLRIELPENGATSGFIFETGNTEDGSALYIDSGNYLTLVSGEGDPTTGPEIAKASIQLDDYNGKVIDVHALFNIDTEKELTLAVRNVTDGEEGYKVVTADYPSGVTSFTSTDNVGYFVKGGSMRKIPTGETITDAVAHGSLYIHAGQGSIITTVPDLSNDANATLQDITVTTWYDQSGNGRDLSQDTDNKQPQIVSSGSVLTRGGKPAIQFDGANDNLWAAESSLHNGHNNQSVFILADSTGSTNGKDLLVTYSSASAVTIVIETHNTNNLRNIYAYNGSQDTNLYTTHGQFTGNQKLITFIATPTQYISRVDGANQQTGTRTKSGPDRDHKIVVGSLHDDTDRFYDGRMQEILLYDSDKSADMAAIETNMDDYWK